MKYRFLLLLIITATNALAQKVTGLITDKNTKQPINGAIITLGATNAYSNNLGEFEIMQTAATDSLKITHFAHKPLIIAIETNKELLRIELEPAVISLNTVNVRGSRDFKQDSIDNRKTYEKQFNYTGPKVVDAFKGGSGNPVNNASQILSVNLLTLAEALTKKSTPEYKFKQTLLHDEQQEVIDRKFNRGTVTRITGLKGDTLSAFMAQYRPTYEFIKTASDYDVEVYIRKNYIQYKKNGMGESNPFEIK